MRFSFLVLVGLALAVSACVPGPAPAPEVDLEAERSALLEADRAWYQAYSASDDPAQVFVGQLTDDAYLLAPETPIAQGKTAIGEIIQGLESMPGFTVSWQPTTGKVSRGADLGHTIGTYEMTMENPEGQRLRIEGKYLTVWQKQADGTWKVVADMFNPNGPPSVEGEGTGAS